MSYRHHDHEIDGKLHDDCAMCDEIRSLSRAVKVDIQAENALEQHRKRAAKSKVGRDELSKASKGTKPAQ